MKMESIPDFPGYFADILGNVYSFKNGRYGLKQSNPRLLKHSKDGGGYLQVALCRDGKRFIRKVYHLVLETFIGKCPKGMDGCHNDGVKTNNRLENLRWDTRKNNQADRIKHGTNTNGEKHGRSKLNQLQVENARWFCALYGRGSQTFLANQWNVNSRTINGIIKKRIWV